MRNVDLVSKLQEDVIIHKKSSDDKWASPAWEVLLFPPEKMQFFPQVYVQAKTQNIPRKVFWWPQSYISQVL